MKDVRGKDRDNKVAILKSIKYRFINIFNFKS